MRKRHTEIVNELLRNHANLTLTDSSGCTPFLCGLRKRTYKNLELLLEKGADPNQGDNSGRTPIIALLFLAASNVNLTPSNISHKDVVETLLLFGADPNTPYKGLTPLGIASEFAKKEIV